MHNLPQLTKAASPTLQTSSFFIISCIQAAFMVFTSYPSLVCEPYAQLPHGVLVYRRCLQWALVDWQ